VSAITIWLPKQFGAWAMLLAPSLTGCLLVGFAWPSVALMAAWVVAYLAFMAVRAALGKRHRRQYWTAAVTYAVVAIALIVVLVWTRPTLLWWAIPLGVLLGGSLALIVTGHERSAVNDACLIGASCLMTAIIAWPTGWLAAAIMAGYFLGTIGYVKTMIRERGQPAWYAGSVTYHLVMVISTAMTRDPWLIAFAILVALRAVLVPKLWPRAKPKWIGIGEITATIALILIVWLTI